MKKIYDEPSSHVAVYTNIVGSTCEVKHSESDCTKVLQQFGKRLKGTNAVYAPRMNAQGADTTTPYYVFNSQDGKGFVIVSGDDRTSEILGYSTTSSFDINNLSSNIRSFMDGMAKEISMLDKYQVKKIYKGSCKE